MLIYGNTLASWAELEDAMCELFHRLVEVSPKMARSLFYSGRSFSTRADLFSAAVQTATVSEEYRAACRTLLKRARQYSSARNTIAHGVPVDMRHPQTGGSFRVKQGHSIMEAGGVTDGQMRAARLYIAALEQVTWRLALTRGDDLPSIAICHEQVLQLPNEALSPEEGQNPIEAD